MRTVRMILRALIGAAPRASEPFATPSVLRVWRWA